MTCLQIQRPVPAELCLAEAGDCRVRGHPECLPGRQPQPLDPAKDLLRRTLATQPAQRLTVEDLLQHPFLTATPEELGELGSRAGDHPGRPNLF
jgi:serine/threonine protein kinase